MLEDIEPPEDAGSKTLARYRYQAELTAQHCLTMIVDDTIERVICEWHEDYIVYFRDKLPVLVSVKHLEESQPRWTVTALCADGGVAHLFGRWRATAEKASCLLRTNTSMRAGADEPGGLKQCCTSQDPTSLGRWAGVLAPIFGKILQESAPEQDEVSRFLAVLRIDDGLPKRTDIRARNLTDLMPDVVGSLGRAGAVAADVYDLVVAEIERASRTEGGRSILELIADPSRFEAGSTLADTIQAKTLDRNRLLRMLAGPRAQQHLVRMLASDHEPSRLVAKLSQGGFGPTATRGTSD